MKKFTLIVCLTIIMWMFVSWVEVVTHNGPNCVEYTYSALNFFKLFV